MYLFASNISRLTRLVLFCVVNVVVVVVDVVVVVWRVMCVVCCVSVSVVCVERLVVSQTLPLALSCCSSRMPQSGRPISMCV